MKKIYKIIFSLLISVSCLTPILIKEVEATGLTFNVPYDEPSTSESQGYLNVLFQNKSSGGYFVMTWIWNITNETGSGDGGMLISITDSKITFTAQLPDGDSGYSFIYRYNGAGTNITVSQYKYFKGSCEQATYSSSAYKIIAYQAKGNVKHIIDESTSDLSYKVAWGSDSTLNKQMNDLLDAIESSTDIDEDILQEIQNLSGDIDTVNTNLTSIIERLRIANNHFIDMKEKLTEIWDSIVEVNFNLTEYIGTRLDAIKNAILGDVEDDGHIVESEDLNDQLSNKVNKYDEIESDMVSGLTESLENININNDLFSQSDFVKTGVFLSTQMTNIYQSNNIVTALYTFGLILGLAFTIIGISVKR